MNDESSQKLTNAADAAQRVIAAINDYNRALLDTAQAAAALAPMMTLAARLIAEYVNPLDGCARACHRSAEERPPRVISRLGEGWTDDDI